MELVLADFSIYQYLYNYNSKGQLYPSVIDPRTGKNIPTPSGNLSIVDKNDRVQWTANERAAYIKEWYDRGYSTPNGGWGEYEIHHIIPREYGGNNDFSNLVPVLRDNHQQLFNRWWLNF